MNKDIFIKIRDIKRILYYIWLGNIFYRINFIFIDLQFIFDLLFNWGDLLDLLKFKKIMIYFI